MEETSFDEISPLINSNRDSSDSLGLSSTVRKRSEITRETGNAGIRDPFAMSDDEFEKLSLYRSQRSEGPYPNRNVLDVWRCQGCGVS